MYTAPRDGIGPVVLHYALVAGVSQPVSAQVTLTVIPPRGPTAFPDTVVVVAGEIRFLEVLLNDQNTHGLDLTLVTDPEEGSASVVDEVPDRIKYHARQKPGTDRLTYGLTGPRGETVATAEVTITIVAESHGLQVSDEQYVISPGSKIFVDVGANDHNPDNLKLDITKQPSHGDLGPGFLNYSNGPGVFTYQANPNAGGATDVICYTYLHPSPDSSGTGAARAITFAAPARPWAGQSECPSGDNDDVGKLTIIIMAPTANDDTITIDADAPTTAIPVASNDGGIPEGSCLELPNRSTSGAATVTADRKAGTAAYTLTGGFAGDDIFRYAWTDCEGGRHATATVTVHVNPPVAKNDTVTTLSDRPVDIDVTDNDLHASRFRVGELTKPPSGTVKLLSSPDDRAVVRYQAESGTTTTQDQFTYRLLDFKGRAVATATVEVTLYPVGLTPDRVHVAPGSEGVPIDVLTNDKVLPDQVTPEVVTPPSRGTVASSDNAFTYTPDDRFTADDSFTYRVKARSKNMETELPFQGWRQPGGPGVGSEPAELGSTTTVTVVRTVAVDDSAESRYGLDVHVSPLENDDGHDGLTLNVDVDDVRPPGAGTVAVNETSRVSFRPRPNFVGQVRVGYSLFEGGRRVTGATLTIQVPERPETVDDTAQTRPVTSVEIPVLANDLHAAGTTPVVISGPEHGKVEAPPNAPSSGKAESASADDSPQAGSLTYTPEPGFTGTDTFTYELEYEGHRLSRGTVRVLVTPPKAVDDELTVFSGQSGVVDVLANDPDGTTFGVQPGPAAHGRVQVVTEETGGRVRYTSDEAFPGKADRFDYEVIDKSGKAVARATVAVSIVQVAAHSVRTWTSKGSPVTETVLPSTGRPAGITLRVIGISGAGTAVADDGAGALTFRPGPGFDTRAIVHFGLFGDVEGTSTLLSHADMEVLEVRPADPPTPTVGPATDPPTPTVDPATDPPTPTVDPATDPPTPTVDPAVDPPTPSGPVVNRLGTMGPGAGLSLTGRGCTPGDRVRVSLAGAAPVAVTAGAGGRFSAELTSPATVGRFEIYVECATGRATVPLDVVNRVSTSAPYVPSAAAAAVLVAGCFLFFLLNGLALRPGRRP